MTQKKSARRKTQVESTNDVPMQEMTAIDAKTAAALRNTDRAVDAALAFVERAQEASYAIIGGRDYAVATMRKTAEDAGDAYLVPASGEFGNCMLAGAQLAGQLLKAGCSPRLELLSELFLIEGMTAQGLVDAAQRLSSAVVTMAEEASDANVVAYQDAGGVLLDMLRRIGFRETETQRVYFGHRDFEEYTGRRGPPPRPLSKEELAKLDAEHKALHAKIKKQYEATKAKIASGKLRLQKEEQQAEREHALKRWPHRGAIALG